MKMLLVLLTILMPIAHAKPKVLDDKALRRGRLPDTRNMVEYETVRIGSQWWMAENLDYSSDGAMCYEVEPSNCKKYGRLYDWESARTACPEGWHLPNEAEWGRLIRTT